MNIRTKTLVIIIVLIELIAAGAIFALENKETSSASGEVEKELSLIARVNTDGSGIYLASEYDADDFITINSDKSITFNKEMWGGKVFGTPGASTIQHVQLMDIVTNEMGLEFDKYSNTKPLNPNTVYFVDNVNNYTMAINNRDILDGGILWEPQYHYILSSGYYDGMVTTNVLFPGHTCCLIAGYQDYLDSHADETIRFLAAYIKAVNYINEAKDNPSGEEYAKLVQICKDNIKGLSDEVIKEALDGVEYKYSDKPNSSSLSDLESDIASLAENLTDLGGIKYKISELGFDSYEEFSKAFIDDSYLRNALSYTAYSGSNKSTISVAAIDGDIHQIAVQVAKTLGYFEEYGLSINLRALPNGGAVSLDILGGQSDLGFMGAPPITSATINAKAIVKHDVATHVEKAVSLISRVNTDGSGIYIASKYNADDFVTINGDNIEYHKEMWGGKVFGTPGSSSIQHVQLMELVQNTFGMKFEKYSESHPEPDTVYFVDSIKTYSDAINNSSILDGGILWEPQYHYILSSDYFKEMATTNVLFPGHTCCLIAGYENYLKNHSDETVRFLAAYIKAVDYINEAKDDASGTKFANLVAICKENIHGLTDEIIKEALYGVTYAYSDTAGTAQLDKLVNDIGTLAQDLTDLGGIKVKLADLGFTSYDDLASAFIDNSYLVKALTANGYSGDKSSITLAAIDGDIHQIAVQVAKTLGYFEEYGLEVTIRTLPNGGGVAQDLLSGQSDLGFMGAPPITSATINAKKIKLVEGEE